MTRVRSTPFLRHLPAHRAPLRALLACLAASALPGLAGAATIDLTSGTAGSTTPVPQSFNETRGVSVTVLAPISLNLTAMRLEGLFLGGASTAQVGARVYSNAGALLAFSTSTVNSGGTVVVPISATLSPGASYRLAFYVETTPSQLASGTMFDPAPPSVGGFPYVESNGALRVDAAWSIASDSFPTNANIFVPLMELEVELPIRLDSGTTGSVLMGQSFNETRGADVTVFAPSSLAVSAMRLHGLSIGSATSALVGARIYASPGGALLASADATVAAGGTVTVPIAASLSPGANYRVAFFVATTPPNQGSGPLFDPSPAGPGGTPYFEATGDLRINSFHAIGSDAYPSNVNFGIPPIELVTSTAVGVPYCFGDGSGAPCPCGNTGLAGRGCNNSASTGGAQLQASGTTSPDTLVLTQSGELATALSIFAQGNVELGTAVPFGDGLRCVGGSLKRLYTKTASGGVASAPGAGDPTVSARSAALGDPLSPGMVRFYYAYYRDADLAFCPAPQGNTFSIGNALRVAW